MNHWIKQTLRRYENELLCSIVPFWEKNCLDNDDGGYYSCLDKAGKVFDTEKYMWMQWRIVYMFATLYKSDYSKSRWLDIAKHGFEFLVKNGKKPDGSYFFALNKQGLPSQIDCGQYTIYSESFAAMGCAALYDVTGEEKYRREALATARIFKQNIVKSKAYKNLPGCKLRKSLGHYMILINLAYVLNNGLDTTQFESDIRDSIEQVFSFWNSDLGLMFENINIDGSFDLDSAEGRIVNPGHALEAMWFILQYAEKENNSQLIGKAVDLTAKILDYGWDQECGGLFYFKDALNKPLLEPKTCLKIWWAHNEAMIAALYAYKLSEKRKFLEWFKVIDKWAWEKFRDPEYGEWYGYVDRKGNVCHTLKGSNWKTFFHLPRYLLTCIRLLNNIKCNAQENT